MATGDRPYPGDSLGQVMSAILRDEPRPLTRLRGDLPEGLERIVNRCLEKAPAQRYQSARELREALIELRGATANRRQARPRWVPIAAAIGILAIGGWWLAGSLPDFRTAGVTDQAEAPLKRKIAVLPLRNLGPAEDEFFAAGITEEIITRLATVRGLDLISSGGGSPFEDTDAGLREIGQRLGVDFVLSGSVRWASQGDGSSRVRISPRLTRVVDNVHLWAEAYDRTMEDIFDVQAEIAIKVAEELGAALLEPQRRRLERRPTENQEAYQAYLRGRFAAVSVFCPSIRNRVVYLQRAVEIDPAFLEAWTVLSQAYSAAYAHCPEVSEQDRAGARRALSHAERLDPDSWQVLVAKAQYLTQVEGDYAGALEPLGRASEQIETSEIYFARARAYRRQGLWNEALADFERAKELDPTKGTHERLASVNMWMRNYRKALEHTDRDIERHPTVNNFYLRKAWIYWLWKGDTPEARAVLETLPTNEPSMVIQWGWFWQRVYERSYQAAIDGLEIVPDEPIMEIDIFATPKPLLRGQAYDLMDEPALARAAYQEARELLEAALRESPANTKLRCALAIAYAGSGLETDALRTVEELLTMVPIDKEPYFGQSVLRQVSLVHTMLGDHDAALDGLETLLAMPAAISIPWLRLDPRWASLWDHPRFRELEVQYAIPS
jgi:TolB-like protein